MLGIPQRFEKTKRKDSVYEILGRIDRIESVIGDQAILLRVDYTKFLAAIHRDATRYALFQTANMSTFRRLNLSGI
jgi:hypothetical protein